jgi:hypothetical protein
MRTEKMHWPALAFEKLAGAQDLRQCYYGPGIPCLTVIDPKGAAVLQSKSDRDAREVLLQLQDLSVSGMLSLGTAAGRGCVRIYRAIRVSCCGRVGGGAVGVDSRRSGAWLRRCCPARAAFAPGDFECDRGADRPH